MKGRTTSVLFLITILGFMLCESRAQTNFIIVPKGAENAFGDRQGYVFAGLEFEQMYDPKEFADLPQDVVLLTGMAFRWDEQFSNLEGSRTVDGLYLQIGVASNGVFSDFTKNLPGPVPIFSGHNFQVDLSGNRGPKDFDLYFAFNPPFMYDRWSGPFVLHGGGSAGFSEVDAQSSLDDESFVLVRESGGIGAGVGGVYEVMVTKFSYITLPLILSGAANNDIFTFDILAGC